MGDKLVGAVMGLMLLGLLAVDELIERRRRRRRTQRDGTKPNSL